MEKEVWKPIKGFESIYEISNKGRVVKNCSFFIKNTCTVLCVVVLLSQLENDFRTKEENTVWIIKNW